jgi:hypothetical protein
MRWASSVSWAEDLRGSFQAVAAEDHGRAAKLGLLVWLARRGRGTRLGLAAAALLLAAVFPAWLLVEQARLRHELATARAAVVRPAEPSRPRETPGLAAERNSWSAERGRLEKELQAERQAREELAGRLAALTRPQVNAGLFSLGLVRGEGDSNQVVVGPEPAWIVLSVELPAADFPVYRATLLDRRGRTLWRGEGLRPTASDTLSIGLFSTLLAPGRYRLNLEGLPPGGRPQAVGEIPFQVVRARQIPR